MQDFRPLWKERANALNLSFTDHIQRCILLSMHQGQEFEDKVRFASKHLARAFSPSKSQGYSNLTRQRRLKYVSPNFGLAKECIETEEEFLEFTKIVEELRKPQTIERLSKHYCVIFMFGDLIPEQILVQGMHASMLMGQKLTEEKVWPNGCDASNLNYLIVRGGKPGEICQQLIGHGVRFSVFEDYDYAFDEGALIESGTKSVKTIMTYPVPGWKKGIFDHLELLRFESNGLYKRAA